ILQNVWLVPKFSVRLISVRQLGNIDIDVLFKGSRAIATKGGSIVFTANLVEGLFQVSSQSNQVEDSAKIALERSNSQTSFLHNTSGIQNLTNTSHLEHHSSSHAPSPEFASKAHLWHYRLGHAGYKAIERLGRDGIIRAEKKPVNKGDEACVPCLAGKMKESFNKKTHNRTHIPARRLHADISGILPESYRGFKYFLLVVDDASRCSWLRILKNKDTFSILPLLKEIILEVQKTTGENVAFISADNGTGEFGNQWQTWLKELGIQFQPSVPYKTLSKWRC
ncbi:hypothetical protein K3495_g13428, partial [Podosphaera aphanis]